MMVAIIGVLKRLFIRDRNRKSRPSSAIVRTILGITNISPYNLNTPES